MAGRGRHRGAALAGRPPDSQRGRRFRERPTARWRWLRRARCLVRTPRSATFASSRCCCWTRDPGGRRRRRWPRPVSSISRWRQTRRASSAPGRRGPARRRGDDRRPPTTSPRCLPRIRATWMAPKCEGAGRRGIQYGPAFTGLAAAPSPTESEVATVLAEVVLPGSIRSQQRLRRAPGVAGCRFQSLARTAESGGRRRSALPLSVRRLRSYTPARNAQYCYSRVTRVVDADGSRPTSNLGRARGGAVDRAGAAIGTGVSQSGQRRSGAGRAAADRRVAAAELPEVAQTDAGSWLLVSTRHRG